jgi:hypothetical protein
LWINASLPQAPSDNYCGPVFCAQVSSSRLTLREKSVLLILDSLKSWLGFTARLIFYFNDMDSLILPVHPTHLIQPFDVAVASALKTYFKPELNDRFTDISKLILKREKISVLHKILVESLIEVLSKIGSWMLMFNLLLFVYPLLVSLKNSRLMPSG